MTIKKQFTLFAGLMIFIPIFCIIYIVIHNYLKSPERLLIQGTDQLQKLDRGKFNNYEVDEIDKRLKLFPPNVQLALIDEDKNTIISNIPEWPVSNDFDNSVFFELIKSTSDKYFYQFSAQEIGQHRITFITRIPNIKQEKKYKPNFIKNFLLFLFFIIFISIFFIFYIFRSITKSIKNIEEYAQAIADDKFDVKIKSAKYIQESNEITSISKSLDKMKVSMIEAQNQKNKFIMGISHDLRTPVAIIKGYIEAISDGVITDPEEIKQTLSLIQTKNAQLESMIDTLINFVKLNSSEIRQNMLPQSITELISDFAKQSEITGSVFKRNVITQINLSENIMIPFDKQLINRAFENIFSNALRYTKDNDTITIRAENTEDSIIFSIEDTGCGIDKEDLSNIFELFYRGTSSRLEEGMGIGLSVVKNIIETHRWKIDVESEKNSGSKFIITIPVNS